MDNIFLDVNRLNPPDSEWRWIEKYLVDKDLNKNLPSKYRINQLVKYLLKEQERYSMQGKTVYRHLRDTGRIKSCPTIHDLVAIQKNIHPDAFKLLFGHDKLVSWGSVFRISDSHPRTMAWGEEEDDMSDLHVPYGCYDGGNIIIDLYSLESGFDRRDPALLFDLTPE